MKDNQFCVLLLDDDGVVTSVVSKALRAAMPDALVLTARTVAEAQILVSEYAIDFFIVDLNLPDGSGMDFLCDVCTTCPDARMVIITALPLPQYRRQATGLGVLLFLEKPVDPKQIISLACEHRDQILNVEKSPEPPPQLFTGSLSKFSSFDIIQLKCLTNVTQVLEFTGPDDNGRVYFENGNITHAQTSTAIAEDALAQILSWRGGKVEEVIQDFESPRTIWTGWQALLLQLAQHLDENATQLPLT